MNLKKPFANPSLQETTLDTHKRLPLPLSELRCSSQSFGDVVAEML